MAKIQSLAVRKARGSMGGMTYSVLKGQQIVKEKATEVSNPRTTAQMSQRIKLANLVALYRANKPWMSRGGFEIKKATESDYNAFVSANIGKSMPALTKEQVANGACVVAPVQVTKGSLHVIGAAYQTDASNRTGIVTDLYLGADFAANFDATSTIAELTAALLENNNGLREGDQLSFIFNYQRSGDVPYVVARYYELVLDSQDNTPLGEWVGDGTSSILSAAEFSGHTDALMIVSDESAFGGCVVLSRIENGALKVSSQTMVLSPAAVVIYNSFTSNGARREARTSYGTVNANFLTPGYAGGQSDSEVPLEMQILSVNGKIAGAAYWTLNANEPLTIQFSKPATPYQSVEVEENHCVEINYINGRPAGEAFAISDMASGAGTSVWTFQAVDADYTSITSIVAKVEDGTEYTISFVDPTGGDITGGDDQTE